MSVPPERSLSSNEKLYLAVERDFAPLVMHALVEGTGRIEPQELEAALAHVHARMPGTRLRLVGSRWLADGPKPALEVVPSYPDLTHDFDGFVRAHAPLDARSGRTLVVRLACRGERTLIAFHALHAAMDGQGMQRWMRAVFAALRGEDVAPVHAMFGEDDLLARLPKIKRMNEPLVPYARGPKLDKRRAEDAFRFGYARRTIAGTVPGLTAKLAVGVARSLGEGERALMMIPVDVRPSLSREEATSTANLSLPLMVPVEPHESWTRVSTRMLDMLAEQRQLARGALDWLYRRTPDALFGAIFRQHWLHSLRTGKYLVSSLVSHTGRQTCEAYSTPPFRAERITFLPCAVPIAPLAFVVSETDSQSEVAIVTSRALWDDPASVLDQVLTVAGLVEAKPKPQIPADKFEPVAFEDAALGLHELVERQVRRTPDAVALWFEGETRSYRAMNERANRLARCLRARGLREGELVGVGLARSFDMVIAILAIMKAKGAYVPLDPTLPPSRLTHYLTDSQVRFVLTHDVHRPAFADHAGLIDLDALDLSPFASHDLNLPVGADDLCYLLYTSGSTGEPKGAMNHHAALTNHFLWMQREYGLGSDDCTLQKTPIGFDASLLEVFLPLQCGARMVITRPEGHKDARYLLEVMRAHDVTFLSVVPSVLSHMLDELGEETLPQLRLLLLGGEEFTRSLFERIQTSFPGARADNLYGPAEASIDTLVFDGRVPFDGRAVPIGRPIANIEALVLDAELRPVEPGELGELVLWGIGVGPGYWNRPDWTRERYIPHPLRPDAPFRAYRTGDMVRMLPDGSYLFCGRRDHQVKIRGVRIELGEVEAQLERVSGVRRAVVMAHELHGQKILVAYCVATEHTPETLRSALRQVLPDAMMPHSYVLLERLPLNPSGKIDRSALPVPSEPTHSASPFVARTPVEEVVAEAWRALLAREPARSSSFYEAGGNSLLAIALVSRVNDVLRLRMHAQHLIEQPVFEAFVEQVARHREGHPVNP